MCGILSTRRTRSRKVLSMAKGAEENTSILLPERLTPMTTAESETVLNSEAVQAVVNCRVARLRGIVRDAELPDIAQEIRLAIWRNLPKYDPLTRRTADVYKPRCRQRRPCPAPQSPALKASDAHIRRRTEKIKSRFFYFPMSRFERCGRKNICRTNFQTLTTGE